MCMGSKLSRFLLALLAWAFVSAGSARADEGRLLDVNFPNDSPVLPVNMSLMRPTTTRLRGTSMVLSLHASLLLRNTGKKQISGLTLLVQAQDLTPSGRGSVSVPSLRVQPGELFPVHIDMEVTRPLNTSKPGGAMVQVSLDCALFSDLTFYGPDRVNTRLALTVYELQARRDRQYLASLLEAKHLAELREELNFGLQDVSLAQLGLELLREPLAQSLPARPVSVNPVAFRSAPVRPLGGDARVSDNEVRSPRVEVRNTSQKSVRSFEMGWIVRDERGRDYVAGSVPSSLALGPVESGRMVEPGSLRFSHGTGQPLHIGGLLAFVSDVEFSDGKVWIPSRFDIQEATSDPVLRRALASSPEEQRLAEVYRRKGMSGLEEELKRPN
jgi:hypothetical protein